MKAYLTAMCGRKGNVTTTGRKFFDEIFLPAVEFHMNSATLNLNLDVLHMNKLSPDKTPSLDYLGMITLDTVRVNYEAL